MRGIDDLTEDQKVELLNKLTSLVEETFPEGDVLVFLFVGGGDKGINISTMNPVELVDFFEHSRKHYLKQMAERN